MATARKESQSPKLALVPNKTSATVLSPTLVTKAKRGAHLKAVIAQAEKELKGIDETFDTFFALNGTREATDAKGNVLVILGHGEPQRLDQSALKAAHPKIVEEFTWAHPWDKPSYTKAPVAK